MDFDPTLEFFRFDFSISVVFSPLKTSRPFDVCFWWISLSNLMTIKSLKFLPFFDLNTRSNRSRQMPIKVQGLFVAQTNSQVYGRCKSAKPELACGLSAMVAKRIRKLACKSSRESQKVVNFRHTQFTCEVRKVNLIPKFICFLS